MENIVKVTGHMICGSRIHVPFCIHPIGCHCRWHALPRRADEWSTKSLVASYYDGVAIYIYAIELANNARCRVHYYDLVHCFLLLGHTWSPCWQREWDPLPWGCSILWSKLMSFVYNSPTEIGSTQVATTDTTSWSWGWDMPKCRRQVLHLQVYSL